jgi:uncharacterized protein YdhG (YjbR/CyaY superfamily)
MATANPTANVDAYIGVQPQEAQAALGQIRQIIKEAAPLAQEVISYAMPAYKYHGMLVYFGAWASHLGFYPGNSVTITSLFKEELKGYDVSKGTIRFPYNKPLPEALIKKIVKARVQQNEDKAAQKSASKKAGAPKTKIQ